MKTAFRQNAAFIFCVVGVFAASMLIFARASRPPAIQRLPAVRLLTVGENYVDGDGPYRTNGQQYVSYADTGSYLSALAGSTVVAHSGTLVFAHAGSVVYALGGSSVVVERGGTVHAASGSFVTAMSGGIVYAKDGATVFADPGAVLHVSAQATVVPEPKYQGAHVAPTAVPDTHVVP